MQDEPDPPRKFYGFKPKEFDRANPARPPAPSDAAAPAPDPGIAAAAAGKINLHDLIRAGAGAGPQLGHNAAKNRDNDVHDMLRDNLARANAAGLNEVLPRPKRPSKRKRDYIFLALSGNAILCVAFVIQPIFAGAGIILYNTGLTWIMWVVMDDY